MLKSTSLDILRDLSHKESLCGANTVQPLPVCLGANVELFSLRFQNAVPLLDRKTLLKRSLFLSQDRVVIAIAFDCVEKMVYWTDITGPAISRASLSGGDVSPIVNKGTTRERLGEGQRSDRGCNPPEVDLLLHQKDVTSRKLYVVAVKNFGQQLSSFLSCFTNKLVFGLAESRS